MSQLTTDSKPKEKNRLSQTNNFNYSITKFFLERSRLTILLFVLLVIVGGATTFLMKTTGFPSPEVKFAIVQTVYPGASSETVVRDITKPLEGAIKDVKGVKKYTSTSNNSFSSIAVSIDEKANADNVRSKIDSALSGVTLPVGSEKPSVVSPDIAGPDYIYTITSSDLPRLYSVATEAQKKITDTPETSSVKVLAPLLKKLVIKIDNDKLTALNLTQDQIISQIKSLGESLPVKSDVTLDNKSQSIVTSLSGDSVDYLKQIQFRPVSRFPVDQSTGLVQPLVYTLSDFAVLNEEYSFDKANPSVFAFRGSDDVSRSQSAVVLSVKTASGTDQGKYNKSIEDTFKEIKDANFIEKDDKVDSGKVSILTSFSSATNSERQVKEVVEGLVGGPLPVENQLLSQAGWLLGGIQLVFLVMVAFVSWRAALVAALSIPMSLSFSTIYLYFTGQNLNTLVLFSLVLVIGLVVDPALVIMESIQRKMDTGLRGKVAVLEAVKDVGNGLFLASLTNVIVFVPFGVVSGVFGQIISYIPLTIIPATIGSYIIPLVFLAWLGGLILRPSKHTESDEEKNLWPLARWLITFNYRILNGSRLIRLAVILIGIIFPVLVAGVYFSTGRVKSVQFSSGDNGYYIAITGKFLPTVSKEDRAKTLSEVTKTIASNKSIQTVFPIEGDSLYYYGKLVEKNKLDKTGKAVAQDINKEVNDRFGYRFFDINVALESQGPPEAAYQVALAIKTNDSQILEKSAKELSNVLNKTCFKDQKVTISDSCDGDRIVTKVDDGYTGKQNPAIEVLLDRNKLGEYGLIIPNAPQTLFVNQQIKELFTLQDGKKIGTLTELGNEITIYLDKINPTPTELNQLKNFEISSLSGKKIKLSDIATISEKTPKESIQRVKGETIGVVQARLKAGSDDQGTAAKVNDAVLGYMKENDSKLITDLGLAKDAVESYSEGDSASFIKSFSELFVALLLAIFATYLVLAVFFNSLTQPLVILYTIPLTFIGMFPALAMFGGGQLGFLEIIGVIILIGIVENVAIFLIDAANQKIDDGWDEKLAMSYASGLRMRPVILTKFTAIASLAPLAFLSEQYRSLSVVIIFGLLSSGFVSLVTTPILFIYFKWLSGRFNQMRWYNRLLFFPLMPVYLILMSFDRIKL